MNDAVTSERQNAGPMTPRHRVVTDAGARDGRLDTLAEARDEIMNLRRALESARVIGAAVGISMATHKLTYEQALDRLQRTSQRVNVKVRELAEYVLMTGTLP